MRYLMSWEIRQVGGKSEACLSGNGPSGGAVQIKVGL
jgi:hypothetical protein